MSDQEPVWMTGVGLATPLGFDRRTVESHLIEGRSGVTAVTRFPTTDYASQVAGQVGRIPCPPSRDPVEFATWSRIEQLTAFCVESALRDSGLWGRHQDLRIGMAIGLGAEAMELWEEDRQKGGLRIFRPAEDRETTVPRVRRHYGLTGPYLTLSAACASSNFAMEIGRRWLRLGLVDVCIAGGCELAVTPIGLATFGNLRALSRRNDAPAQASRPFDRGRDGFVLGEGGVLFTLERASDAGRRSAVAYAEVAGCGASSDAHHHVIPSPDPTPASNAIQIALKDARVNISDVEHINAHATSTQVGDAVEARVLHNVFGADLTIPVTSTKSMTGHMLTGAGAFEALACITAMREGAIPPTINLEDPDVDLRLVANEAMPHRVRLAVSNSFGFGGSNTCLVLRAV